MATWEKYEDAAREVVRSLADEIGLVTVVDEKTNFQGQVSPWEIEVAGYRADGRLVVFECRKRGRNVEKGEMGAFAYVVEDLGATGFVVSQRGFSAGARKIADHHRIERINLIWDETTGQKLIEFMGRFFAQRSLDLYTCEREPDIAPKA